MFLGLDLGTSEAKAVLMNDAGKVIAHAGSILTVSRPHPHWSEQAPDDWWLGIQHAIDSFRLHHRKDLSAVRGIGLSGQMHGAVLLDGKDRPLRPAILWNDTRSDAQCLELTRRVPALSTITGNLAMAGFTAPKLLWVQEHEPEKFERTASVLLPKDYLRLCLTGDKISDMSDASGTLWLDVAARAWSATMLAATGLNRSHMPTLIEGNAPSGHLRKELADRWGMRHSVVVAGGAGDNAASAIGIGAVSPGDGFVSLGTSGVLFVVTDRFRSNPRCAVHSFCHAVPGRWHQMSVMLSAASCLRWVVGLTGACNESALLTEVSTLDDEVRRRAPIFLPYLSGERTPHNDPNAQGAFFGLTHETHRGALAYAVMEGVAFGLADGWVSLGKTASTVEILSLVGGGARSNAWAQLIASTLNTPIRTSFTGTEGAALGAARLAQLACGHSENEVCSKPETAAEFAPEPRVRMWLEERQQGFRALYATTRPLLTNRTV